MALTRKALKAMGLADEQVDSIIEMHSETVDGLKADLSKYKENAEKLPSVQKELDDLKAAGDGGWKEKHDAVQKEFSDYKTGIEARESRTAKENAAKAYFASKNISNINLAMRSSSAEIEKLELDGEKIKDTAALDALVAGDLASLVEKPGLQITMGGKLTSRKETMTKEDIIAIKDGAARRKAIAENPELFGIGNKT